MLARTSPYSIFTHFVAAIMTFSLAAEALGVEVITFEESLVQPEDVRNQYCAGNLNRGVSFLDESEGGSAVRTVTSPVVTASPTHALTNRYGSEFEELKKIVIRFTLPQVYVSVNVGLDRAYAGPVLAALTIYDGDTPTTPRVTYSTNLGAGPTPITQELTHTSATADIRCVSIVFHRIDTGANVTEIIDNLKFSTAGPPCGAIDTTPPVVQILKPTSGTVMHDTYFELQTSVSDVGTGVAKVAIQFLNASGNEASSFWLCGGAQGEPCGGNPVTAHLFTWITPDTKVIRVKAWDYAGLTGSDDRPITFIPLTNANIWVHAMEIIQATDPHLCISPATRQTETTWCATSPSLSAGRRTVLRVYPGWENGGDATVYVDGECRCKDTDGQPCPGPQIIRSAFPLAINPADNNDVNLQQADPAKSLNFVLPEAWTTWNGHGICLTTTLSYELECSNCVDGANSMTLYNVHFIPQATLDFVLMRACIRRNPADPTTTCDAVPADLAIQAFTSEQSALVRTYPVALKDIRVTLRKPDLIYFDGEFGNPAIQGWMTSPRVDALLDTVEALAEEERSNLDYYCVFPAPVTSWVGLSSVGRSVGKLDAGSFESDTFTTIAHESGHGFGLPHAGCWHGEAAGNGCDATFPCQHGGICVDGFDAYHLKFIEAGDISGIGAHTHDLMSYGSPPEWLSNVNYYALQARLYQASAAGPHPTAQASSHALLIRGLFQEGENCSAQLEPIYEVPSSAEPGEQGTGSGQIELRNRRGGLVFKRFFEPERRGGDPPDPAYGSPPRFSVVLPLSKEWEVQRVTVIPPQCTGVTVTRTANAPSIQLSTPLGGEFWSTAGTHTIAWNCTDADPSKNLHYRVQYSRDGGDSWTTLAQDLTAQAVQIPGDQLAGTTSAKVRVLATDGLNTSIAASGLFQIEDQSPLAAISSPSMPGGAVPEFAYHDAVVLEGLGTDSEDGPLANDALSWYSDRDGLLGAGHRLDIRTLSLGYHLIQLLAADRFGKVGVAVQAVHIAERLNTQPIAAAGPDRFVLPGQEALLDGTRSRDRNGDDLLYAWTVIAAPSGANTLLLDADAPTARMVSSTEGEYVLGLVVSDVGEDSLESQPDQVRVMVSSTPPPPNDACANAIPMLPGWYLGTMAGASPDGAASCGGRLGQPNEEPDVWFAYTAPQAARLRISTCGTNDWGAVDAGMDSVLSIYSGCPGTVANQIANACNDDWPAGSDPEACNGIWPFYDAGNRRDSALLLPVATGQTILIRLSRYATSASGIFYLTLNLVSGGPADFDQDGNVDQDDLGVLMSCLSGPNIPRAEICAMPDLDHDGDVDQADFGIFQRCFSGSARPADPNCAN